MNDDIIEINDVILDVEAIKLMKLFLEKHAYQKDTMWVKKPLISN